MTRAGPYMRACPCPVAQKAGKRVISVTDQAAVGGILTKSVNRRNRMAHGKRNDLIAPADKKSARWSDIHYT
jgi:hypothetical protein